MRKAGFDKRFAQDETLTKPSKMPRTFMRRNRVIQSNLSAIERGFAASARHRARER
jgi:hypothetical protein